MLVDDMWSLSNFLAGAFVLLISVLPTSANEMVIDNFQSQPETRWRFFADTVMGGVSTGNVSFLSEEGTAFARLAGRVSTANNGGFIQMRIDLPSAAPSDSTGVRLIIRGNDQRYFVHLRTGGTLLPWQYYQAGFVAAGEWTEIRLPFTSFKASGPLLRKMPRAQSLKSLGIVAFGRDHIAQIDVRQVAFY